MQSQKQTVISDAAPKKRRSIGIYTGKGKKVLFNIKDRISGTLFTEFAIKKSETVFKNLYSEENRQGGASVLRDMVTLSATDENRK